MTWFCDEVDRGGPGCKKMTCEFKKINSKVLQSTDLLALQDRLDDKWKPIITDITAKVEQSLRDDEDDEESEVSDVAVHGQR